MAETTAEEVHSQLSGLVTLQPPLEKGEKRDGESGSTGADDGMDGQDAEEVQVEHCDYESVPDMAQTFLWRLRIQ